jgi:DNA-binding NarL/FixJ family response regulator
MSNQPMTSILLLSDDLFFTSRVAVAADAHGMGLKVARDSVGFETLAHTAAPGLVLIDLGNPGLSIQALLTSLRSACATMPRVVAYGAHVDVAGLRAAREAGCDLVLPRSAFVEQLPKKMKEWAVL